MIQIKKYTPAEKQTWNLFNSHAKNGTLLFYRDYLEYHADRFTDHSLLFYQKDRLIGLLPLHAEHDTVASHNGLTFGGIICGFRMKTALMVEIFVALLAYRKKENFRKLVYKPVSVIYHQIPAQEDLYALYLNKAVLHQRAVSSVLILNKPRYYNAERKRLLRIINKSPLRIAESEMYLEFMTIVKEILWQKYKIQPVHTAAEISYLAAKFPENIKLFLVYNQEEILGGTIMYIHKEVAHMQYIGFTNKGKKLHALDLLVDFLIEKYKQDKIYLNFGVSTGQELYNLNTGLLFNKESYGAAPVIQDTYIIDL